MKKKYNNDSNKFADWTMAKLNKMWRSLDRSIFVDECYGMSDMKMLVGITAEIAKRKAQKMGAGTKPGKTH